jgi:hypothetical protein
VTLPPGKYVVVTPFASSVVVFSGMTAGVLPVRIVGSRGARRD